MKLFGKVCAAAVAVALSSGVALAKEKLSIYHWFEYIPQNSWTSSPRKPGSR